MTVQERVFKNSVNRMQPGKDATPPTLKMENPKLPYRNPKSFHLPAETVP